MTTPTQIAGSVAPVDPSMADLLNLLKKEIFFDLNCHHLGTIQSFDSAKQTASISINYTKTFFQINQQGQYNPVQIQYPPLVDVPVIFLGGGGGFQTFPVAQGDQCLVLFNDRSIDNWYQQGNGVVGPVNMSRAHSLADGFALVGLNWSGTVLANFDTAHAIIRNKAGDAGIGLNLQNSKTKIYNSTGSLNSVLQNILTQLENLAQAISILTVTCASPGNPSSPPINATDFVTIKMQLTTLASDLGNLIE